MEQFEYLLVVRHGRVDDLAPVEEVARKLVETLDELLASSSRLSVGAVEHACTEASRATADVFAQKLGLRARAGPVALGPEAFPPYAPADAAAAVIEARSTINERIEEEGRPWLMVGHEPAIDWLLHDWVDWGKRPLALAPAELACLSRVRGAGGLWHLWWVLTPSAAAAIEPLREKISSKMTVLSVLAGFSLAVAGAVLIDLPKPESPGPRLLAGASAACFLTAATGYVCVLLALDQLMMPSRFWHAGAPSKDPSGPRQGGNVVRPPSSAGLVLYQQMTSLWAWVVRALLLSGVGIGLLALSQAWRNGPIACGGVVAAWVGVAVAIQRWWSSNEPRLGTED
jgi:hypothetical protein